MTTEVMEPPAGHKVSDGPIFVTINCNGKAGYLQGDNQLNEAVYRQTVHRINCDVHPEYFYPTRNPSSDLLVSLGEKRDLTIRQLRDRLYTKGWLQSITEELLVRQFANRIAEGSSQEVRGEVTCILFDKTLNDEGSTLLDILASTFPDARLFAVDNKKTEPPIEVMNPSRRHLCLNCGIKMRPVGSVFTCDECSSIARRDGTSVNWPDHTAKCEKCSGSNELKMYGAVGALHDVCQNCGHAKAISTI